MNDQLLLAIVLISTFSVYLYFYLKATSHMTELGRKRAYHFLIFPGLIGKEHFDEVGWKYFVRGWYFPLIVLLVLIVIVGLLNRLLAA